MTRSNYKPAFITKDIYRKIQNKGKYETITFKTRNRNTTITKNMIGCLFKVYCGNKFLNVTIANPNMIGHKLGEFAFTKRMGSFLHKRAAEERTRKKKQKLLAQQQSRKKGKTKKNPKSKKK